MTDHFTWKQTLGSLSLWMMTESATAAIPIPITDAPIWVQKIAEVIGGETIIEKALPLANDMGFIIGTTAVTYLITDHLIHESTGKHISQHLRAGGKFVYNISVKSTIRLIGFVMKGKYRSIPRLIAKKLQTIVLTNTQWTVLVKFLTLSSSFGLVFALLIVP